MSEGELKQRILKKGYWTYEGETFDYPFMGKADDPPNIVNMEDVFKVLGEAKEDLYHTEDELTEEWFAEHDSEFRRKILEKIEKWFGSEAP